jgi:hypothetical protein
MQHFMQHRATTTCQTTTCQFVPKTAAARALGCDRGTVARYCKVHRYLMQNGKVDLQRLQRVIAEKKMWERRGWQAGRPRPQSELALGVQRQKKVFNHTMEQRLAIIAREIDAMSDQEQARFFTKSGQVLLRKMFRQSAIDLALGDGERNHLA